MRHSILSDVIQLGTYSFDECAVCTVEEMQTDVPVVFRFGL